MKDQLKKAAELAENELQEKEVSRLKGIIKSLLEKKKAKEAERDEVEEDIKLIKQDIDDFKAGRLDKIKERHDLNPRAKEVAPINITIINDNSKRDYPHQPWRWNYEVLWQVQPLVISNGFADGGASGSTLVTAAYTSTASATVNLNGQAFATFTTGSYSLGDGKNIINL